MIRSVLVLILSANLLVTAALEHSSWMGSMSVATAGIVRCYCNLPVCVSTGYMCRSTGGGCFSDVLDQGPPSLDLSQVRHGCLELLPDRNRRSQCQDAPSNGRRLQGERTRSLLLCCSKDMCNHIDSPETRTRLNDTFNGFGLEEGGVSGPMSGPSLPAGPEPWFRAAIIAVPICGTLILFALIAVAIRIMRADSQPSKLGDYHYPSSNRKTSRPHALFDAAANPHHYQQHQQQPVKKLPLLLSYHNEEGFPKVVCCAAEKCEAPLLPSQSKNEQNAILNIAQHNRGCDCEPPIAVNIQKLTNTNINENCLQLSPPMGEMMMGQLTEANGKLYDKQVLGSIVGWTASNNNA